MGEQMSLMQRVLGSAINWAVERYFPTSVFYGAFDPFAAFDEASKGDMTSRLATMAIIRRVQEMGADEIKAEIEGMTIKGEPVGDWLVIVRRKGCDLTDETQST